MAEQGSKTAAQSALPLEESPEFKAMVTKAVAEQIAALALPGAGSPNGDIATMNSLALALAELSGQGQGKTFVDPKVLKMRRDAEDEMWKLIIDAHRTGKIATYQLTGKVVLDHELVEPFWIDTDHTAKPTVIDWNGAPNGVMIPVNDTARAIHAQFKLSVGSTEGSVDRRPMGITPGGLVVHGGAVPKRRGDAGRLPQYGETLHDEIEKEQRQPGGLSIHHKNAAGQQAPVHILGTIAAPATEITSSLGQL